jgi:hypothetical protein
VAPWQINNIPTPVHILELDNDAGTDDFYLHSYAVAAPDRLIGCRGESGNIVEALSAV